MITEKKNSVAKHITHFVTLYTNRIKHKKMLAILILLRWQLIVFDNWHISLSFSIKFLKKITATSFKDISWISFSTFVTKQRNWNVVNNFDRCLYFIVVKLISKHTKNKIKTKNVFFCICCYCIVNVATLPSEAIIVYTSRKIPHTWRAIT